MIIQIEKKEEKEKVVVSNVLDISEITPFKLCTFERDGTQKILNIKKEDVVTIHFTKR